MTNLDYANEAERSHARKFLEAESNDVEVRLQRRAASPKAASIDRGVFNEKRQLSLIHEQQKAVISELLELSATEHFPSLLRRRLTTAQDRLSRLPKPVREADESQLWLASEEHETLSELLKRWMLWLRQTGDSVVG